ncbi:hypothetical protein F7R91_27990 [Streptomyces luteolifulvus]|uniref:Uncharacterized protein n=1 Tax=Streptomyces luteolifulvus TaxID=2615112 RepID=A0A6H9UW95_9ACTN|nr:hypothetical protein [Streptomyces luteolifulvus]KAB1142646.1 hypothetical protein F7R91_27990 [Streptomyces luteolifulvus]
MPTASAAFTTSGFLPNSARMALANLVALTTSPSPPSRRSSRVAPGRVSLAPIWRSASFARTAFAPRAEQDHAVPPQAVIAQLANEDVPGGRATKVDVAGAPALRRAYRSTVDEEKPSSAPEAVEQAALPTQRVDYVIPVPDDPGRWISINFSTPGDGDIDSEFTGVLVELFDAVVGTFRWSYE